MDKRKYRRCKDCDRLFVVNNKNNQSIRCEKCQHLETQRIKREWKRNYDKLKK